MVDAGPDRVSGIPPRAVVHVPCATCGSPTDPLRAARVAMFDDKFRYFCSAECRTRYDAAAGRTPLPLPRPRTGLRADARLFAGGDDIARSASRRAAKALEAVEGDRISELGSARRDAMNADVSAGDRVSDLGSPILSLDSPDPLPPASVEVPAPTDVGSMLIAISLVAGALSAALVLVGPSPIALSARLVLVLVATGSFVAHAFTTTNDASELHPVAASVAPIGAALVALVARLGDHPLASEATGFAGVLVSTLAVIVWLLDRAGHPIQMERALVRHGLTAPGHRIVGDDVNDASFDDLRPGEEIVVEAGEVVPVDATVVAGRAAVHAWFGATGTTVRDEGDTVVAGARVVEGRLRAVVGWAGNDRAYMRLTHDPRRRAAVFAPLASFGRSVATRGSIVAAVVAALAAFSGDRDLLIIALYAVAAHAAFANRAVAQIAALHVEDTVLTALRRGVIFRSAEALDRAGKVSTAAFCARGTLLLGEPEVANIEAFGSFEPDVVLGYIAGTESGSSRPTAVAIQRAARARGIRPDGVRSPATQPGLGVTAVASSGQTLVVGSRGLMMRERISVALAESKIADLEAMGRTVMLCALGGRLIGLIGLHDGLRPGARAAVQHLLDSGVEPVLLSGDTRDTCEALGRAVDIDHIRPEVLPQDRGDEIRRLADGGAVVAVLGRSPNDDVALAAADVSVALDSGGGSAAEWSVQLASDDVRDGAFALRLAHACRRGAGFGLAWAIGPSFAAALLMCVGLAPLAAPPLVALAGAAVAVARLRSRR